MVKGWSVCDSVSVANLAAANTLPPMKAFLNLAVLCIMVYGFFWYLGVARQNESVRQAEAELVNEVGRVKKSIQDELRNHSLEAGSVQAELEATGKVARKLAREVGAVMAEAGAAGRVTATIKAKLVADPELSALAVSVNTTDGLVTLSGTAPSYDLIGKAMLLALGTDGVHEVVSTLQLRQTKE